ncbi:MAG: RagB/SusD family nutrient uptake outer membrane protein, partial [Bacteroidales bacterium]|nr:RagB/SusD family nutrient uptake outer membrane protein [Bacteroidales bacterium]
YAIDKLTYEGTYDQITTESYLGELHFLRGWVYFQMVKRYGGVPLIDRVQSLDEPADSLYVPRSSETEIYDFIAEECDKAETLLDGKTLAYGRATKWVALGLKSRAMMYAGSIGEFGVMQLDGLLGINNADKYWQLSYDASKKIIDNGPFQLYDVDADPEKNFYNLFTSAEKNTETIFAEVFNGVGSKAENYSRWCPPQALNGLSYCPVYLESFEMYEYIDGTSGKLNRANLVRGFFYNLSDFIGRKDPRCRASIFLPESKYATSTIYLHEGTYQGGTSDANFITAGTIGPNAWPAKGPGSDPLRTGMYSKKRCNEKNLVNGEMGKGSTDFMVIRLGEIYLNYAEAAFALEKNTEALQYLNRVRRRADMPDKATIDWDIIRNERAVELMFEGHRFWDLRRWRIADVKLASATTTFTGVRWRKNYDTGQYEVISTTTGSATDPWPRIFRSHFVYTPIGKSRTDANKVLVENPGY